MSVHCKKYCRHFISLIVLSKMSNLQYQWPPRQGFGSAIFLGPDPDQQPWFYPLPPPPDQLDINLIKVRIGTSSFALITKNRSERFKCDQRVWITTCFITANI